MAQCVEFKVVSTEVGDSLSQPVLVASSQDIASCGTYLLVTPQEFSSMNNPFFVPLSITDGLAISGAIGSLWALAVVFKAGRRLLSSSTTEE